MSFLFELRLTPPQINMLMYFGKAAKGENPSPLPRGTSSSTASALVTEGFLIAYKEKTLNQPTVWEVTKKGFLVIELIKEEIKSLQIPKTKTNWIAWYDMPDGASRGRGIGGSEPRGVIKKKEQE